jgi:hypothetical protein
MDLAPAAALAPAVARGTNDFDAFTLRISASGAALEFSRVFAGSANDGSNQVMVAADGQVWVSAFTDSTDVPLIDAVQSTIGGGTDCYVLRLNGADGQPKFASYLGGSARDALLGIAPATLCSRSAAPSRPTSRR